jgi:predicted transposase YbfD/YdcC
VDEAIDAPPKPQHGRREWRRACVWTDHRWQTELGETSEQQQPWPMVRQVVRIERRRQHLRQRQVIKEEHEVVYFLKNHPDSAVDTLRQVRAHWRIENLLHRQRDVLFDQDRSTIRCGTAPRTFTTCRNLALTLLYRWQTANLSAARRTFAARPHLAVAFILSL